MAIQKKEKATVIGSITIAVLSLSTVPSCSDDSLNEDSYLKGVKEYICPQEVEDFSAPFKLKRQVLKHGKTVGQSFNGLETELIDVKKAKPSKYIAKTIDNLSSSQPIFLAGLDVKLAESLSGFLPKIVRIDVDQLDSPMKVRLVKERVAGRTLSDIMQTEIDISKIRKKLKSKENSKNQQLRLQLAHLRAQSIANDANLFQIYYGLMNLKSALATRMVRSAREGLFIIDINPNSLNLNGTKWKLAHARAVTSRREFADELEGYLAAFKKNHKDLGEYQTLLDKFRSDRPLTRQDFLASISLQNLGEELKLKELLGEQGDKLH